jgi:hypothetical protein
MAYLFLVILGLLSGSLTWANSCCGQSPASFTVLAMQQRLSITTGVSYLQSQGRVYSNSDEFFLWDDKEREVRSLLLNVASVVADRHQVFVNTAFLEGRYADPQENGRATHLSDTLLGYSYELLPEYRFSYWKPVVHVTAFLNLPTGRSIYDGGQLSEGADVTGHGQWGTGVGVTLRKVYFPWTLTLQGRSLHLFAKRFNGVGVSGFFDSSLAFLVNFASRWWGLQFNSGLTFNHLSERQIVPSGVTSEVTQNFAVLAGVQRSLSDRWVAGVTYTDQTLVGPAKNSILNQSINFTFNYNYF